MSTIQELTAKWYRYVNIDHHKDRDCHFYVKKVWSYGDPPYYLAEHNGYIGPRTEFPKRSTAERAEKDIHDWLTGQLEEARRWAKEIVDLDDDEDWNLVDAKAALKILEEE